MPAFPGFPTNDFDFHYEEVGAALAGLIARNKDGVPKAGVLPSNRTLLTNGTGWLMNVAPLVVVRVDGRKVLLGGCDETQTLEMVSAPTSNSRLDVIYSLPANVSEGNPVEAASFSVGVPSLAPVKPSIPEGAVELGTLLVSAGNSSIAQATLTHTFPFSATAGGTVIFRTTAEMNAWTPEDGARAYCLANSTEYLRTASSWKTLSSVIAGSILEDSGWVDFTPAGWTVQETCSVRRINGVVYYKGVISNNTFTSASHSNNFFTIATVPAGFRSPPPYRSADAAMNSNVTTKVRASGGSFQIYRESASNAFVNISGLSYPIG